MFCCFGKIFLEFKIYNRGYPSEFTQCIYILQHYTMKLFANTFAVNTTLLSLYIYSQSCHESVGRKPFSILKWFFFFLTQSNKIRMTIKLTCQHRDCPRGADGDPSQRQTNHPRPLLQRPPVLCKCDSLCPFVRALLCDTRLSKCYEPMEE